jgi:processive 1,2-diacylglycerol beta-glucosyltransferase
MKKILLFPLLDSLPSGHHQVADAITQYINNRTNTIECKKIDLMYSWNPVIEPLLSKTYLWWIQQYPKSYAWVYKKLAYKATKQRSYKHYDLLFEQKMKEIIAEEQPDLMICTHALPSYFLNKLKNSGMCTVPVINIYTDFFINDVWGRDGVDFHFVPNLPPRQRFSPIYITLWTLPTYRVVDIIIVPSPRIMGRVPGSYMSLLLLHFFHSECIPNNAHKILLCNNH